MPENLVVAEKQWDQIFPNAPDAVIEAFARKTTVLIRSGVLATRNRLAFFCANIEHECGGFTIKNLTENINYTATRMAQVWPNRFSSASAVQNKYGTAPGWQLRAFDDIYGNRMGNRPGTHDGSIFIGRGGPQWTGRDGYAALTKASGIEAVEDPTLACRFDLQPEVCVAFWTWKKLNSYADNNNFLGAVKIWNGGTNGLADRKALMAGNSPVIARLALTSSVIEIVNTIPAPLPPASHPVGGVVWIQESLNKLATAGKIKFGPLLETKTGVYGTKTHAAVEAFQTKFGISPVDGIAGKLTIPAIQKQLTALAS